MENDTIKIKIGEKVEFKGRATYVLYPPKKGGKVINSDNPWACIKFAVIDLITGTLSSDEYTDGIILTGDFGFDPINGENRNDIYKISFTRGFNNKRNAPENTLVNIGVDYDFNSEVDQKNFLRHFLTDKQISSLYALPQSPFKSIADGNVEALCQAKGIGDTVAQRIIDKYKDHLAYAEFYVEFPNLDLTNHQIMTLIKYYGSVTAAVSAIKENPYSLMKVNGFSFIKCDNIAIMNGLSKNSVERIKAFLTTYLQEKSDSGLNWMEGSELNADIFKYLGDPKEVVEIFTEERKQEKGYTEANCIAEAIKQLKQEDTMSVAIDFEKPGEKKYYLNSIYKIEQDVAKMLCKLVHSPVAPVDDKWEERVRSIEQKNGWEFNKGQWDGIKKGCENNVLVISGGAGCVDADTEFFNGIEWKRIADFEPTDKVLQYKANGYSELVKPASYIKQKASVLCELKGKKKEDIDMCLSMDHNCLYIDTDGVWKKDSLNDILNMHKQQHGFRGRFPSIFKCSEEDEELTDTEVLFIAALIHSGEFCINNNNLMCLIRVGLNDLTARTLKECLSQMSLQYTLDVLGSPHKVYCIQLSLRIYNAMRDWTCFSVRQAEIMKKHFEEYYTAYSGNEILRNKNKQCADFIQGIYAICGKTIGITKEESHYSLFNCEKTTYTLTNSTPKKKILIPKIVDTKDGYQYCFSVPSGNLVLRRNGKIFITGNCGKTALLKGLLSALNIDPHYIAMCAFTGKAAARMQESTGRKASTIHKLLKIQGDTPEYNENNPLPYKVIIMDEFSMTPIALLRSLLKAMDSECRFILLGDMGQLQSISMGNVAHDLINSKAIPSVTLTEVMRQAQDSGIICTAHDISHGKKIFQNSFSGDMLIKNDTYVFVHKDSQVLLDTIISDFKKRWDNKKIENKKDFIFLAPVKNKGSLCTAVLNNAIQEVVNPQSKIQQFFKEELAIEFADEKKNFKLRVGDCIICNRNKYGVETTTIVKVPTEDGDHLMDKPITTDIFNGWTGELIKLDKENQMGYFKFFECNYTVVLGVDDIKENISLGYAISVHKSQGGEWKEVYVAVDNSAYTMLTREILYTVTTRAKSKLLMYVSPTAFNRAINIIDSSLRRTFLMETLEEEDAMYNEIPF
ncbi:MAG: AAA family ATPase [Oscillospiraceae bacterium]|nr:AAA family ATPase [Oscillospiraceae bacterium]